MNVIMAIVPGIDYPLMAKLLPWCMKQTGYDEWLPVLEDAIRETRIAETEAEDIPDGCFAVWCEVPESLREYSDLLSLAFLDPDWKVVGRIWPDARLKGFLYILQAGYYQVVLTVPGEEGKDPVSWVMTAENWVCMNGENPITDDILFTFTEDCVYELPTDGLE